MRSVAKPNDYKRCAKMIREHVRKQYGCSYGSAWAMLVPHLRTAIVRSQVLSMLHARVDGDDGSVATAADFDGMLAAAMAEFGEEIEQ